MFDYDINRMIVGLLAFGGLIGGAIVAFVLLALPWLWSLVKPALHAFTA